MTLSNLLVALSVLHGLCTALLTAWVVAIARRPSKRDMRIVALESECDTMAATLRKLSGRVGRIRGESDSPPAQREEPPTGGLSQRPGEDYLSWKARARALIAQGVKPAG